MIKARGFKGRTNLHSYKTYAYIIAMLFIRALKKGEITYKAMIARGFNGKFYSLYEFEQNRINYIFTFFMIVASIVFIYFEWLIA